MKFKYNGSNDVYTLYGIDFPQGEAVEVDEKIVAGIVKKKSPAQTITVMAVDKLKGNPEFEQVKLKPGRKPKKVEDADSSSDTQSGTE